MPAKRDHLIAIEFCTGKGYHFRRKLRALGSSWYELAGAIIAATALSGAGACAMYGLVWPPVVILVAAIVAWKYLFSSDRIMLSQDCLAFPTSLIGGTPIKTWTDLERAELLVPFANDSESPRRGSSKGTLLKLTFRSGSVLRLPVSDFTRDSLQEFSCAIEKWATECKKDERLSEVCRLYDFEQSTANPDSGAYTRFWEEQLGDHYSFTSFVPLSKGAKLQNGRLTVEKDIACGGFSAIYLVRDESGNAHTLKESVIPPDSASETVERVTNQFRREAALLSRLSHDNVAKVFDHFVEGGRHYLVLEYIQGVDLRELVRTAGPREEIFVLRCGMILAETLHYLHSQPIPIVHRDVTPDNIVLNQSGEPILIDFGAANEFVGGATGTLIGKQAYMPPEQIRGKSAPCTDLYALGATLYFMLTGVDPEPLSVAFVRSKRADIGSEFDDVIARMTRLDSEERVASALEVSQSIRRIIASHAQIELVA